MIALGHTGVGVIIGVVGGVLFPADLPITIEIIVIGAFGICSHYAMDLIPHGHYNFNQSNLSTTEIAHFVLDMVLPIILLALYLLPTYGFDRQSWLIGAGVFGAQLPDILMGLRSKKFLPQWRWLKLEAEFHSSTHWHNPNDPLKATNEGGLRLGLTDMWQFAVVVLAVALLIFT